MKKKIRIISADFGNLNSKNNIYLPEQESSEFEVTTFNYTDTNYYSREKSLSPRLKGKIPKILDWITNDADYYIWLDSYYNITSTKIHELTEYVADYDICLNRHPFRSSIEEEVGFVIEEMKEHNRYLVERYEGEPLEAQVKSYLQDKTFSDNRLYALGFFIYKKSLVENINNLMTDWFFHNCYWSIQDQLSMPYLLHKHKITPNVFDFDGIYNNPYAEYIR